MCDCYFMSEFKMLHSICSSVMIHYHIMHSPCIARIKVAKATDEFHGLFVWCCFQFSAKINYDY